MLPDEGARAGCVRLGQTADINRDDLENTADDALAALAAACPNGHFNLIDADAPEAILETFLDQIAEEFTDDRASHPEQPPPIFYADSIQTMRTHFDDGFDAKRMQIGYIMGRLVAFSVELPAISILISHVNRPAFASKKHEDRIDPMAGAAEAADITRSANALLHLEGELDQLVTGWLRKNRLHRGARPKLQLRYDIPRGAFVELDADAVADARMTEDEAKTVAKAAARQAANEKTLTAIANEIERAFKKVPKGERLSLRQLQSIAGGKFENVRAALIGLEQQGAVDWTPGPRNAVLWGWKIR